MSRISVCMGTYNGEKYIRAQLDSILKQLSVRDEVIISDDSSTDGTINIIKSINDRRIRLIEHNQFNSPVYNFENALRNCSGDFIFLSDQDDIWLDNKIETVTRLLLSYDLVVSDCIVIDENGKVINDSFFELRGSGPGIVHNLTRNSFLGCCMAFDREILEKALPFPKNTPMHDMWIGMIGELFGKTYFCEDRLVKFRRHGNNASAAAEKSTYSVLKKSRFRSRLLYNVIKRYINIILKRKKYAS